MAKKELSVEERLKLLFALQEIDSKIDEIEILKGELPIEVSDLEDEIVGLEKRVTNLTADIDSVKDEASKHQANIKDSEALQQRYQKQLDDVKNNREFDALTKELELQKLEIQLSEKRIKEAGIKIEAKNEVLNEAIAKFEQKKKDLETKKVELEKIIKKTDKEEKALQKKSDAAKALIDDRLIKAYDRIRQSFRNGLSVVTVERDSCGGCFNRIPPQMQLEISQRKKIIACEHCGRILVDNQIAGISEEVEA
jgi:predicted  nucleic acid-binding Zn-ribbon protein